MYTLLLFQKQLDLYVAAAGFHPARVLPCVIDVGTNNEALRKDRTYLGLDQPRLEGDEYLRCVYTPMTFISVGLYPCTTFDNSAYALNHFMPYITYSVVTL
jgi:malate dehydrogenase (decarboxylating)